MLAVDSESFIKITESAENEKMFAHLLKGAGLAIFGRLTPS
jgi:hypothetical protein